MNKATSDLIEATSGTGQRYPIEPISFVLFIIDLERVVKYVQT